MNKLIIMCGVIGSGKSTWVRKYLETNPDTLVISKDDIRRMLHGGAYDYCPELEPRIQFMFDDILEEAACLGLDIILDECHLTWADRHLAMKGREDFSTHIVYFPPKDKEFHINRRMQNSRGYSEKKWEEVYDEMWKQFDPPTSDECDELIVVEY